MFQALPRNTGFDKPWKMPSAVDMQARVQGTPHLCLQSKHELLLVQAARTYLLAVITILHVLVACRVRASALINVHTAASRELKPRSNPSTVRVDYNFQFIALNRDGRKLYCLPGSPLLASVCSLVIDDDFARC